MRTSEYLKCDMIELARLVARREVSAPEVLDAAVSRMSEVNPTLNAVVVDWSDRARREAERPLEGPLAGVPYLLKDHGAAVAGAATAVGSAIFKDAIQPSDSAIVTALRKAGLVIFGKTNVPELCIEIATESRLYGPARNPWDLGRSPGGSSGGAAAAVAAGIVPGAHASDGGGSIRLPASWTGLFGLKPSRGRVSSAPANEGGGGFVVQHALTRSVRDSALLLDIVSRPQPGDPYWLAPPVRPFVEEAEVDPGILRIGFTTRGLAADSVTAECREAVLDAARFCASLGHVVEEIELPSDFPFVSGAVGAAGIAVNLEAEARRRGRPIAENELGPWGWAIYQRGKQVSGMEVVEALQAAHAYGRRLAIASAAVDVVLTAATASPAIPLGEMERILPDIEQYRARFFELMPNTTALNFSGQPAMSVPLAWSAAGLPIGLQFIGKAADEATLFRLAGQLERARPWFDRRPPSIG